MKNKNINIQKLEAFHSEPESQSASQDEISTLKLRISFGLETTLYTIHLPRHQLRQAIETCLEGDEAQ